MSSEVEVDHLPKCDLCSEAAGYDSKTVMGPWAYLCETHWKELGVGRLGTGFGQRLVVRGAE